jgi:O-antigen ligase
VNAPQSRSDAAVRTLWAALIVYPWINPFAGGPSSAVQPWLASALCASFLFAFRGWRRPSFPLSLWIAAAALAGACVALPSLEAVSLFASLGVVLAMAGTTAAAPRDAFVRAIALAWLISACANGLFALLQYFGLADALVPWVSSASIGEAFGNLRQRNQLATHMAIGLGALLWFVRQGWRWRRAIAPLAVLAAGSAASASRTGALEWLVLVALIAIWRSPRWREQLAVGVAGLAIYVGSAVLLPFVLEQALGVTGPSVFARFVSELGCSSRRVLWSNVLHLIAQRPWSGWGWGELDYAHYMTLYPGERFCDILDNAHSLPLHLAVELGVPVAVVACAGLAWAFVRIAPWREQDAARQLGIVVAAVILLHSLLEYPLWYGPFQIAFGLALGLLWPAAESASSARRANACAAIAVAALIAIGYAGWDYRRISQIYTAPEMRDAAYRDDPLPLVKRSRLFRAYVDFAELTITPLTRANAQWTYAMAQAMLHYSPEPRVIEKLIESASMLGHRDVALAQAARYKAAFPREYAAWAKAQAR